MPAVVLPEAPAIRPELSYRGPQPADALAVCLAALAPCLRGPLLREAFDAILAFPQETHRAQLLIDFAPYLPEGLFGEALAAVRALGESVRPEVLIALAARLPAAWQGQMLAAAMELPSGIARGRALAGLVPYLPAELLARALAATEALDESRAAVLLALAPHLPEAMLADPLTAARGVRYACDRGKALIGVARRLPDDLLGEALAAIGDLDEQDQAELLVTLVPRLPPSLLPAAVETGAALRFLPNRAKALAALAPALAEPERSRRVTEVFQTIERVGGHEDLLGALTILASLLPGPTKAQVLDSALERARNAVHPGRGYHMCTLNYRHGLLTMLIPLLEASQQSTAVSEALAIVEEYPTSDPKQMLLPLAPYLSRELLPRAEKIDPKGTILSSVPQTLLPDVLRVARAQRNQDWLFSASRRLPDPFLPEALAVAKEIGGSALQWELMATLPEVFCRLSRADLYKAWHESLRGVTGHTRQDLHGSLQALSPILTSLGGPNTIRQLLQVISDLGRWWP
jgi:hypothetical protein